MELLIILGLLAIGWALIKWFERDAAEYGVGCAAGLFVLFGLVLLAVIASATGSALSLK